LTAGKKNKIFLIGFMGCGKSTLGKKIAHALHYEFVDLDLSIEQKAGESINSIFEKFGEDNFRSIEDECLHDLELRKHIVVATGGGTPVNGECMSWMLDHGCCIYIRMPEGALLSRLRNAAPKRPLLAGKNEEELRNYIHEKLSVREPVYSKSHIVIDGLQTSSSALAGLLKRKVDPVTTL
jgi:shikimate kinase